MVTQWRFRGLASGHMSGYVFSNKCKSFTCISQNARWAPESGGIFYIWDCCSNSVIYKISRYEWDYQALKDSVVGPIWGVTRPFILTMWAGKLCALVFPVDKRMLYCLYQKGTMTITYMLYNKIMYSTVEISTPESLSWHLLVLVLAGIPMWLSKWSAVLIMNL